LGQKHRVGAFKANGVLKHSIIVISVTCRGKRAIKGRRIELRRHAELTDPRHIATTIKEGKNPGFLL
jgi:hypothetical protein